MEFRGGGSCYDDDDDDDDKRGHFEDEVEMGLVQSLKISERSNG